MSSTRTSTTCGSGERLRRRRTSTQHALDRLSGPLRDLRDRNLVTAGIPYDIPIRVTENRWPTGMNPFDHSVRTYEAQAEALDAVIRAVDRLRLELNITHYDLFGLRDADSGNDELFHQFGILQDDYTPKPAFHAFRHLVNELGPTRADAAARSVDRSV